MVGNKENLFFDIGNETKDGLLRFDIWFCGLRLTNIDNLAYPPPLIGALESELEQLNNAKINPDRFWFYFYEITDNFSARIKLRGEVAFIYVDFEDSLFKLSIPIVDLSRIYSEALKDVSAKNT